MVATNLQNWHANYLTSTTYYLLPLTILSRDFFFFLLGFNHLRSTTLAICEDYEDPPEVLGAG